LILRFRLEKLAAIFLFGFLLSVSSLLGTHCQAISTLEFFIGTRPELIAFFVGEIQTEDLRHQREERTVVRQCTSLYIEKDI
jgi:hypothetical protein